MADTEVGQRGILTLDLDHDHDLVRSGPARTGQRNPYESGSDFVPQATSDEWVTPRDCPGFWHWKLGFGSGQWRWRRSATRDVGVSRKRARCCRPSGVGGGPRNSGISRMGLGIDVTRCSGRMCNAIKKSENRAIGHGYRQARKPNGGGVWGIGEGPALAAGGSRPDRANGFLADDLGLRSLDSLQPRLSYWGHTAPKAGLRHASTSASTRVASLAASPRVERGKRRVDGNAEVARIGGQFQFAKCWWRIGRSTILSGDWRGKG